MTSRSEDDDDRKKDAAREAERMSVETQAPIVLTPDDARQGRRVGLIYALAGGLALVVLVYVAMSLWS